MPTHDKKRPDVGDVVRYYSRRVDDFVEARVVQVEPFNEVFGGGYNGNYLTLDNDYGIHEDNVKMVI